MDATPSRIEVAFERSRKPRGVSPPTERPWWDFGGDGSISVPLVAPLTRGRSFACLMRSPHRLSSVNPDHPYDAASQFSHVAMEQRVSAGASYHVEFAAQPIAPASQPTPKASATTSSPCAIISAAARRCAAELHAAMKGRPIYLSWDMDPFDPSVAPACARRPGAVSPRAKACTCSWIIGARYRRGRYQHGEPATRRQRHGGIPRGLYDLQALSDRGKGRTQGSHGLMPNRWSGGYSA